MKRWVPKSLAGQMIALLLIVLVLAQLISVLIFADERRLALKAAAVTDGSMPWPVRKWNPTCSPIART